MVKKKKCQLYCKLETVRMHKYSRKEDEFLINNVKGITLKELTKRFNDKFKADVKESSIANRKLRLGLKSGITGGQFKKGHVPANKGKKGCMSLEQYQKCKATMFKKEMYQLIIDQLEVKE